MTVTPGWQICFRVNSCCVNTLVVYICCQESISTDEIAIRCEFSCKLEMVYSQFQSLPVSMLKSCCQFLFASGRVCLKMTQKSKHTLPSALSAKVSCWNRLAVQGYYSYKVFFLFFLDPALTVYCLNTIYHVNWPRISPSARGHGK